MELKTYKSNTEFIQCLEAIKQPNAKKALSALYSASPYGLLEEFTRKFESSRSVWQVLMMRYGRKIARKLLYRVIEAYNKVHNYRLQTLKNEKRDPEIVDLTRYINHTACPAELLKS